MMKSSLWLYFLMVGLGCAELPETDEAQVNEVQAVKEQTGAPRLIVDVTQSKVSWTAAGISGIHNGEVAFVSGYLELTDEVISGGSLDFDMTTVRVLDLDGYNKQKLEGMLRGPEFFKTSNFSSANFTLSEIHPMEEGQESLLEGATHMVSGNLTMMNKTKGLSFPARVYRSGEEVSVVARFSLDRTDFGMNFRTADSFGDKQIHPKVNIDIELLAR